MNYSIEWDGPGERDRLVEVVVDCKGNSTDLPCAWPECPCKEVDCKMGLPSAADRSAPLRGLSQCAWPECGCPVKPEEGYGPNG